jgi:hypothetical protein
MTKQEQEISEVVHKANTEYWQNSRENDMEYSKGNKRPHKDYSLPELITIRVNEYLKEKK